VKFLVISVFLEQLFVSSSLNYLPMRVRDEGGEKLNPLDLLRKRFKQLIYKKQT